MGTTLTDAELLEDLRNSPRTQQIVAERQEARLAERRSLAEELSEVIEGLTVNYPKLRDAEERLGKQIRRAEESLEALRRGYGAGEERETHNRLNGRKSLLEGELLQTAPAAINIFIKEVGDEWEAVRARGIDVSPARRNPLGEMEGGASNAESVKACMEGLREAQRQAESLKFVALTADELRKRLDKIRAGIPAVGPMVEA